MSDTPKKCRCWSCKTILIALLVLLLGAGGLWWWSCGKSCDYQGGTGKKGPEIMTYGGESSKKDCHKKEYSQHCDKSATGERAKSDCHKKESRKDCDKSQKDCDKSSKEHCERKSGTEEKISNTESTP
jgi:hypothetical protein